MFNIKLLNKISPCGTEKLPKEIYSLSNDFSDPDAILVRSAQMHDMPVPKSLTAVARAGAGVNNIPTKEYADAGIVVFNTPGANANGVKELAIASMLLASRSIVGGIDWVKSLTGDVAKEVEAGKSKFAGSEIKGKTLGVVGLGAIGGMVANAADSLGMHVLGHDPYITVDAAWHIKADVEKASSYDELFEKSDFITLHVPATPETKNMICADSIAKMKKGVKIINLSRADLVNIDDMKAALESGHVSCYVTDFPTADSINVPGIVAIPHLGASTEESEDNCAVMAAGELRDFLENGNIKNSVNYPPIFLPNTGLPRVLVLHKNVPNVIASVTGVFGELGINIEHLANRTRGDYACMLMDISIQASDELIDKLNSLDGVIKARKIK